jgi:hypothetical protein
MVVVRLGEVPALYVPRQIITRRARADGHGAMHRRSVRAQSASAIGLDLTAIISDTDTSRPTRRQRIRQVGPLAFSIPIQQDSCVRQ